MAHTPDFDLGEMIGVLKSVIEQYAEGTKERDATKLAQAALLYMRDNKKEDDFARYYKKFTDTSFTIEVSHEFATREEADKWLASGKAQHAEHVKIAGKGFLVVQLPGRMTFIDRPLPEELKTEEWTSDSE
ncbi:hypothetical protein [Vitiosangium sp. GDMCC 1.1324]|uniref:hypothetical protein n=1 Tax=Vitiosangium sp. (strain GDMCC 1.1324) TaxID=2138576 RepID=UPI001E473350|nr:hypothetical protein [Vitiosangium sp. GDMCC 1.1324]